HQAITMIVAVVIAVSLWALLHRTRTGAEMRATVDDRALAGLMGADPLRASRVAWILGTQLAAVGGILIAPELTMDATQLSLLIVSESWVASIVSSGAMRMDATQLSLLIVSAYTAADQQRELGGAADVPA